MARPQLSTLQINKVMKDDDSYLGTFAINKIPTPPPHKNVSFIVNLQSDNLPGNHWVAVRRLANGRGEYFDSFGRMPPMEIQHWLVKHSNDWTHNTIRYQKPNDKSACGYLCIAYLKNMIK